MYIPNFCFSSLCKRSFEGVVHVGILSLNIMPRKTFISKSWLNSEVKDKNVDIVSDWCIDVKLDPHSAYCKVCHRSFSIANMRLGQILSHGDSEKHKANINNLKGQTVKEQQNCGEKLSLKKNKRIKDSCRSRRIHY